MIRKAIAFSLILLVLFLGYQFLVTLIKDSHSISYSIDKDNNTYIINEKYIKNDNDDYYFINVEDKDDVYIFEVENNYNKQRQIVEDVIPFKNDELSCLTLKVKNDYSTISCRKDGHIVEHFDVLDEELKEYINKYSKFDYDRYNIQSEIRKDGLVNIYNSYLEDNETIMMYEYKRITFHNNKSSNSFSFSLSDVYKNTLGVKVGKYYLIPKYTTSPSITYFYKYNVIDRNMGEITLDFPISKQTYINGIYEDKIYIFDKSNLVQYEIDVDKDEQRVVGNTELDGVNVVKGEKVSIPVYSLNEDNVTFTFDDSKYDQLKCDKVYNVSDKYAICEKNNEYYKVYSQLIDNPIFLFSEGNIKDIKIVHDNVYYLKGDSIYRFNKYGTLLLLTNKEFNYNYENVFDIYYE